MSISSYVVQSTKETGNIDTGKKCDTSEYIKNDIKVQYLYNTLRVQFCIVHSDKNRSNHTWNKKMKIALRMNVKIAKFNKQVEIGS